MITYQAFVYRVQSLEEILQKYPLLQIKDCNPAYLEFFIKEHL